MSDACSFNLKLDRAREHLQCLNHEIGSWVQTEPYSFVDEVDPEPLPNQITHAGDCLRRRIRVARAEPVPDRISLLVGDCVFNLRSALDHLALALARKHTPRMNDREIRGSEFPVFEAATMDMKAETKKIGCIAPAARAAIKTMQPYHRGHQYANDPLWLIHDLNRIDKHRSLNLCGAVTYGGGTPHSISFASDGVAFHNVRGYAYFINPDRIGMLQKDQVVFRWGGWPESPDHEMRMELTVRCAAVFGDGGPAALQPVVPTLTTLCDFVRDGVISPLAKFL